MAVPGNMAPTCRCRGICGFRRGASLFGPLAESSCRSAHQWPVHWRGRPGHRVGRGQVGHRYSVVYAMAIQESSWQQDKSETPSTIRHCALPATQCGTRQASVCPGSSTPRGRVVARAQQPTTARRRENHTTSDVGTSATSLPFAERYGSYIERTRRPPQHLKRSTRIASTTTTWAGRFGAEPSVTTDRLSRKFKVTRSW
jgi:hypothetical protein